MAFTYRRDLSVPLTTEQMDGNLDEIEVLHDAAALAASTAEAAANFNGDWSLLTGALAVPASVNHSSSIWLLLNDLADVAASEPGVTADWEEINRGDTVSPASSTDNAIARYDGTTGKLLQNSNVTISDANVMQSTGTGGFIIRGKDATSYTMIGGGDASDEASIMLFGGNNAAPPNGLAPNGIKFQTGAASEKMRLVENGNLLIGTTSDNGFKLRVNGGIYSSSTNQFSGGFKSAAYAQADISSGNAAGSAVYCGTDTLSIQQSSGSANIYLSKGAGYSNSQLMYFRITGTVVGSITTDGTNTAYNTSSDYRLKCNWQPIESPTELLMRIKPYEGEFKAAPGVRVHYCIAHELQEVLPQAVTGEKDGKEMQGVDYSKIVPLLVASLQDAHKMISELRERVSILESLVDSTPTRFGE